MTDLTLTARHVALRRMEPGDAEILYSYRAQPDVSRYQDWLPHDLEEVRDLARAQVDLEPGTPDTWLQFVITRLEDGAVIGDCGILFPRNEHDAPELGIALMPENRRRGYAQCATRLMLDYLFEQRNVHRVVARTDPRNLTAIGVLDRVGMVKEAHLRRSHWQRGEWVDDLVYAMLREEWVREREHVRQRQTRC